ncbi:cytochrome P450 [Mollisia scopiformis]|uniref:Cytochrome P450 n=1 Tax=Mollisia scopiformis TaxID=149040 RepID=A0A132B5L5_MOLSC|nr:cytochrome P450 [Mollisia scopiformis]KUJ07705.1 cytochrome P450 [Mollisia scopiformis]
MITTAGFLFSLGGALSGVAIHHGLFIHGEWHHQAPNILRSYAGIFGCVAISQMFIYGSNATSILTSGLVVASILHVFSLIASILVYRGLFHRLNNANFDGPWWARYTKIWQIWENRHSKNHLYLHKLYQKYGDVVRTGPAEVTVFIPEAHEAVGGRQSECIKSEFYDLLWPEQALFAARNKAVHAKRRKDWQYGFSPSAIQYHEAKVLKWIDELDRQLEGKAKDGSIVDATEFLLWFTFDIMGDFTFSKSFGMLESQKWHNIIVKTQNARTLLGPLTATPWLLHIGVKLLPRILWVKDWYESVEWCQAQMEERLSNGSQPGVPDLTSFFMENNKGDKADPWLRGDSLLAILAGSEPTAQILAAIFHELSMHPKHIDKIREELSEVCITDFKALTDLPHLNAVIQEAMRLHPNLLTGGSRKTTENGVTIGDVYIPPHITVITPHYTIARREDCFEQGTKFIPERWTTKPEMVRNPKGHIPFSIGQYNCIGQHLAWRIMRYTVARIVWRYTFHLAPGYDGHNMEGDKVDRFTAFPGIVPLCFKLRD